MVVEKFHRKQRQFVLQCPTTWIIYLPSKYNYFHSRQIYEAVEFDESFVKNKKKKKQIESFKGASQFIVLHDNVRCFLPLRIKNMSEFRLTDKLNSCALFADVGSI